MAAPPLAYGDYLKAAFHERAVVPGLGAMPVNYLGLGLFAVLGLANPGFWLLGAALEIAYLTAMSGSGRYQKLVQARRLKTVQHSWVDRVKALVEGLGPQSRERYDRLLAECRGVLGLADELPGFDAATAELGVRDLRSNSLNQLLWIYLRLLRSQELIEDSLSRVDRQALAAEVKELEGRLATTDREHDPALARSLEGTLDIQRRRLANLERASGHLSVVRSELDRIERHVELIREEAAVSGRTEVLSDRLDAVTNAMSETNRWMSEHAEFLGSLGGSSLADDVTDLPPPSPPMPRAETEG
jgi:hypothetical protein